MGIPGDTVQHERIVVGMKTAVVSAVVDEIPPEIDSRLVRHKLAAAGIFEEDLAHGAVRFETAENLTAGAMEEVGDGSENFALCPFARAWRSKQQDGAILHGASLCLTTISLISVNGIRTSSEAPPRWTSRWRSFAAMRLMRWPWYSPRAVLKISSMSFSASRRTAEKKPANLVSMNRLLKVNCPR